MKEIYNEGRVTGFSAYELYVRQQLADDPDASLPSEKEWLSSMLADGNTMLLKIKAGTEAGYHDYPLPETSYLAAASTIVGSIFIGEAIWDGCWATKVIDYGDLISDTEDLYPVSPGTTVPAKVPDVVADADFDLSPEFKQKCLDYSKIVDGICYQPGSWDDYHKDGVEKEFRPDFSYPPRVRIRLSATTDEDVYVLLQGFLSKEVIKGMTNYECGMDTDLPEVGDFLGPMCFPWATKIIFGYSMEMQTVDKMMTRYSRKLPDSTESIRVDSRTITDFDTTDPNEYYRHHHENSNVPMYVTELNDYDGSGVSILAAYQKDENYPPALYAAKVSEDGLQAVSPIDVAAPGTMKGFIDEELAEAYPENVNNVYGVYLHDNQARIIGENDLDILLYTNALGLHPNAGGSGNYTRYDASTASDAAARTASAKAYDYDIASVTSGNTERDKIYMPAVNSEFDGNVFNLTGSAGTDVVDKISVATILTAAKNNTSMQVIREDLKKFRDNHLAYMISRNYMNDLGTVDNYITFSGSGGSGKRLYISASAPAGARNGDIGIGW